jgi:phage shock protein C
MTNNSRDEHARSDAGESGGTKGGAASSSDDFNQAVERLESSLRALVDSKKDASIRHAAALIEEAGSRLRDQLTDRDDEPLPRRSRRNSTGRRYKRRHLHKRRRMLRPGSDHLYRGPNKKIGGVCAALARYFGIEAWMVRLAAVSGMIFVPGLTLPAYIIACFVIDTEPRVDAPAASRRMRGYRWASKGDSHSLKGSESESVVQGAGPHSGNMAGQVGFAEIPDWQPRKMLTYSRAELAQAELRLRRIESFVTSDQYELRKELTKMEQ